MLDTGTLAGPPAPILSTKKRVACNPAPRAHYSPVNDCVLAAMRQSHNSARIIYLNSGKTGFLYYLQLLSGPDKVQFPYNTSYPTYFIAASLRTVLLGPQRLVISCLLFRCAMALANHYYATSLWSDRRHSKLLPRWGFEPRPIPIVSLLLLVWIRFPIAFTFGYQTVYLRLLGYNPISSWAKHQFPWLKMSKIKMRSCYRATTSLIADRRINYLFRLRRGSNSTG